MGMYLKDLRESSNLSKSLLDRKPRTGWVPTFADKMKAWNLYCKGFTDSEIARHLGVQINHFAKFNLEFRRFFETMKKRRPEDLPKPPQATKGYCDGHPFLSPNSLRMFAMAGITRAKLAELVGVTPPSITNFFTRNPDLEKIFATFSEIADAKVIYSLFKRANGMKMKKVKHATYEGAITDEKEYEEELPPSVEAAMHWLVNRKRWRRSDGSVLSSNKGTILEALEEMTRIDDEQMEELNKQFEE